ncbi:MAG: hypothetical protein QXZ70_07160 [Candidatus Bathyarchaeia archaeon]
MEEVKNRELEVVEKAILPQLLDHNAGRKSTLHMSHIDTCRLISGEQRLHQFLTDVNFKFMEDAKTVLEFYSNEYGLGYFVSQDLDFRKTQLLCYFQVFARGRQWAVFNTVVQIKFPFPYRKLRWLDFFTLVRREKIDKRTLLEIIPINAATAKELEKGTKSAFEVKEAFIDNHPLAVKFREFFNVGKSGKIALNEKAVEEGLRGAWYFYEFGRRIEKQKTEAIEREFQEVRNAIAQGQDPAPSLERFFQLRAEWGASELVLRPGLQISTCGAGRITTLKQGRDYVIFEVAWHDPFYEGTYKTCYLFLLREDDYILLPVPHKALLKSNRQGRGLMSKVLRRLKRVDRYFRKVIWNKLIFLQMNCWYLRGSKKTRNTSILQLSEKLILRGDVNVAGNWLFVNDYSVAYDPQRPNKALALWPGAYVVFR